MERDTSLRLRFWSSSRNVWLAKEGVMLHNVHTKRDEGWEWISCSTWRVDPFSSRLSCKHDHFFIYGDLSCITTHDTNLTNHQMFQRLQAMAWHGNGFQRVLSNESMGINQFQHSKLRQFGTNLRVSPLWKRLGSTWRQTSVVMNRHLRHFQTTDSGNWKINRHFVYFASFCVSLDYHWTWFDYQNWPFRKKNWQDSSIWDPFIS